MPRHSPIHSILLRALIASAAVGGAGCSTFQYSPKRYPPPTAIAEADWPKRDLDRARTECDATPDEIRTVVLANPDAEVPPEMARFWHEVINQPVARVVHKEVVGQGLLRVFAVSEPTPMSSTFATPAGAGAAAPPDLLAASVSRPRLMRFLSFSTEPTRPVDEQAGWMMRFAEGQSRRLKEWGLDVVPNDPHIVSMARDGTRLRVSDPSGPAKGAPPKGLIVYLPGLGSQEYEWPVVEELRRRGWCVLNVGTPRVWWYEPVRFEVRGPADVDPVGRRIARVIDDQIAEPAYAAEVGLSYVKLTRPELQGKPVVLMGFSAGAIFAPAVGARLHDQLAAVVLIGGGGNVLKISQTSDLTNGGLELVWPESASMHADLRDQLFEAYMQHSRLDPAVAARALTDLPTLVALAEFDATVPAGCGRLLASALPNADRLNFTLGHRLMFWKLKNRAGAIAEWVERTVDRGSRGAQNALFSAPP